MATGSVAGALAERKVAALGLFAPPPIHIESPRFTGSLAMLFTCVAEHRVDLRDVPLLPICEAYVAYLLADASPNLEEAASALTALAYLLEKKAWSLLPSLDQAPEELEPPELAPPCAHLYWDAIKLMRGRHEERSKLFFRDLGIGASAYELPYEIDEITPTLLADALRQLLERAAPPPPPEVFRHKRSLTSEMGRVLLALSYEWKSLNGLIPPWATREDVVYWFLSLLELMRLGQASARIVESEVQFARP